MACLAQHSLCLVGHYGIPEANLRSEAVDVEIVGAIVGWVRYIATIVG